ncbi:uncharacterized protein LOC141537842 isoform X2 [Cotesia typhae]|uniref:uncharacterized protein LOC141537842 isoform X2 n=1 Tax=Cotesia typhae TaxID=2053667 RepID=UPI003D68BCB8
MIDNKLTCLNQKVDAITQRLNTLEAAVKVCQSSNDDSFHRPNYLPFKTQADILKYNESSDAQVTEMKKYLSFYNMHTNLKDNTRDILQKNRLMTDDLLTQIIWMGKKGQKTNKLLLAKHRIAHDLCSALRGMYPDMTFVAFKRAVAAALNAANSRVLAQKNSRRDENSKPKKNKANEEEHFLGAWTLRDDEELLEEDDDDRDENGNQKNCEMLVVEN